MKNNEQLVRLVQSGRGDFGIGNSKVITYTAHKMNSAGTIRFLSPPLTVEPLYIGFSRARIAPEFVTRFSTQLQKFKSTDDRQTILSYSQM